MSATDFPADLRLLELWYWRYQESPTRIFVVLNPWPLSDGGGAK